ncbi:hypothetical protein EJV47_24095 [Hymenobacter gummosus]|uniref:Uncharacterized protein n=1 Tax=Hymenobacter gummosus TaxID=1776032 RepID=A0A3S0JDP4_9BACT|nr:hypothetical protein [Hymenobacter gummosus]RTQ45914.1 hypothetical protein EJV47_24095 [Hymenobacter gummosus]
MYDKAGIAAQIDKIIEQGKKLDRLRDIHQRLQKLRDENFAATEQHQELSPEHERKTNRLVDEWNETWRSL